MQKKRLEPQRVSELIDSLMSEQDPAVIGLRRILKKKADTGEDFPLKQFSFDEMQSEEAKGKGLFSADEQRILQLEKENIELKQSLERLKKDAEHNVSKAFETGTQEGLKKGEQQGFSQAKKQFDQQVESIQKQLQQILTAIKESRKKLILEAHHGLLELSLLIARKVIGAHIAQDETAILHVIKRVLAHISDRQSYIVRVSPNDLETVTGKKEFWTTIADRLDTIVISADERIERGGCVVESSNGSADGRISVQLKEIEEQIEQAWNAHNT